jgi:adenosylcobinamide-phosphate synthase
MFSDTLLSSNFESHPAMTVILAIWLALALERFVPISSSIDPLRFFRFICQRMAHKVLKANYSAQQAKISGSLGLFVLVLPLLAIVYLVREFASYQWLIDSLIMWLLLQYTPQLKNVSKSIEALSQDKKQLSKSLLQVSVLRQTNVLSPLGLHKAALETLFLRYSHQYITTLFWYFALGPVAALFYRLIYEASQIWTPKLDNYKAFGACSSAFAQTMQIIPSFFTSISFVLFTRVSEAFALMSSTEFYKNALFMPRQMLLQSLASALQVGISGPVMYGESKKRYQRLVQLSARSATKTSRDATSKDIKVLISRLNKHLIVTLVLSTWVVFWLTY